MASSSSVSRGRPWLMSQLQRGVHVEEYALVRSDGTSRFAAVVLQDTHMIGILKPQHESLQQYLSSGVEVKVEFDVGLRDIIDLKVRRDSSAHAEKIRGLQCLERVYSLIVKKCLNIKSMDWIESDGNLTTEYYNETVTSLKLATNRQQLTEILNEFATECQGDLALKRVALLNMDVFLLIQTICRRSIFLSDKTGTRSFPSSELIWASSLDVGADRNEISDTARGTVQTSKGRAEVELLERFRLYESALNVLVSVMFGSDLVHLKHKLIGGPSPLTIPCWLALITCDVHVTLAAALGFDASHSQVGSNMIEEEILRSIRSAESGPSATTSSVQLDLVYDNLATSVNSLRSSRSGSLMSATKAVSSQSSSLERRIQRQLLFSRTESVELMQVRQSTFDMQCVLLYQLCELTVFGRNKLRSPYSNVELHIPAASSTDAVIVDAVGECLVRMNDWDVLLEYVVMRCLAVLEDFLNVESVAEVLKKEHFDRKNIKSGTIRDRRLSREADSKAAEVEKKVDRNDDIVPVPLSKVSVEGPDTAKKSEVTFSLDTALSDEGAVGTSHRDRSGYVPVPMSPNKRPKPSSKDVLRPSGDLSLPRPLAKFRRAVDTTQLSVADQKPSVAIPDQADTATRYGSFLEAQEVLIFYFAQLLSFLSEDCTEIRKELMGELKDYIIGIVSVLRYLCPLRRSSRAIVISTAKVLRGSADDALKKQSGGTGSAAAAAKSTVQSSGKQVSDSKAKLPDPEKNQVKNAAALDPSSSKTSLELVTDTRYMKRMHCSLAEFEPCRFNMTSEAWTLLLLTSIRLEGAFDTILDHDAEES